MSTSVLAAPSTEPAKSKPNLEHRSQTATLVVVAFALVYLLWGSTFLAIRIGIESVPPLLLAGSRHLLAGLLMYPFLRWKLGIRPTAAQWRTALITGSLLQCVGNGGVSWAEKTVPSGLTALLVATVSLWLVIIEWLRPGGTRPSNRVILGVLIGIAGMVFLVGPSHLGGGGRVDPVGAGVLVFASFAWACGSLYSKHGEMPSSPFLGVAMQSLCGGTILWIIGLLSGEGRSLHFATISSRSWLAIVYLAVFGSCVGFSAYIYILKKSTAARVSTYALVNPVVALFLGWLFLREAITPRIIISSAVILTAVLLVITAPHKAVAPKKVLIPAPEEA